MVMVLSNIKDLGGVISRFTFELMIAELYCSRLKLKLDFFKSMSHVERREECELVPGCVFKSFRKVFAKIVLDHVETRFFLSGTKIM